MERPLLHFNDSSIRIDRQCQNERQVQSALPLRNGKSMDVNFNQSGAVQLTGVMTGFEKVIKEIRAYVARFAACILASSPVGNMI